MKRIHVLTAMAASLVMSAGAMAQSNDVRTGDMSTEVLGQSILLTQVETLRFGTFLPFGRVGTIRVTTNGLTQGFSALSTADGGPAVWTVEGINSAPYHVALPVTAEVNDGTGNIMSVNNFQRTGGTSQLFLDAAGEASFTVGADLRVGVNQPAGNYTGTYQVTVSYN